MSNSTRNNSLITFLSDFGLCGGYAAACEAVLASLAPDARVLHLSHEVGVGDVRWGSLVLARLAPFCPPCAHLAVVDPGVGTDRRPVVLVAGRGDLLVGPDNGLLMPAVTALGGLREAWLLDSNELRQRAGLQIRELSATFHGRDVFAPAIALLTSGTDVSAIATPLKPHGLVDVSPPKLSEAEGGLVAEVIEVDRFGNVGLSARFADCDFGGDLVRVEVEGEGLTAWDARVVRTFGQLNSGELGVFEDSWGQVALALNGASAAQLLMIDRGAEVRITKREER